MLCLDDAVVENLLWLLVQRIFTNFKKVVKFANYYEF